MTAPSAPAGSGPVVVFLHGGGLSRSSWAPVVERLPGFATLTPDLPGHGERRSTPFTFEAAAEDVVDLIRRHAPGGRAHLVGLSLGGAVALTVLRTAPTVVDRVVLSGCAGRLDRWLVRASLPLLRVTPWISPAVLVRATMRQHRIPVQYQELVRDDLLRASEGGFLRQMYTELTRFEMPATVSAPLLVSVGAAEAGASRWLGSVSLEPWRRYPGAVGVSMPGGSHAWPLQFPGTFAEMVRGWVTGGPLPSVLRVIRR